MSLSVASPVDSFSSFDLRPETRGALDDMGISVPTLIQAQTIPALLQGHDVVGQAWTGSGKTLAFGVPLVERCDAAVRDVQALVLAPTRELANQVGGVLGTLAAARHLKLVLLYGGRSLAPERQALVRGAQIVVGTPGRILDHLRQGNLSLKRLRLFVLDEGDAMLDQGFAPDVERILAHTPPQRQTALFSATVPPWVMSIAARHLRNPVVFRVHAETEAPPDIHHIVYQMEISAKLDALRILLDNRDPGATLVFGRTKHGVAKLASRLASLGYPVAALQGNLSQNARERVMADFRSGRLPILLATNVAARGLDIEEVGQVINYELPESAQLFTHRVGRTGRMGRKGSAITFVTPEDSRKWGQIERELGRSLPRTPWMDRGLPLAIRASGPSVPPRAPGRSPARKRRGVLWG